ncbi:uncharacterized protein LOC142345976 isoform X1 [Convolutriloba macropyga]|uniref:uncharacterized protein LOC142345976 isoform X1 n=1 Tax=Convolutriloba macropyga TaxID=536237 RepID=UPI003F51BFE1
MMEKRRLLISIGAGLVLSSLLWALLANGKSGYTGFISEPFLLVEYSYGLWKYCENEKCYKYDFDNLERSFVMKMKSARVFYMALCPFAAAAFTGYMLASVQGNRPLVLSITCSAIQGAFLVIANICLTLALKDIVPEKTDSSIGWSLILPWVGVIPAMVSTFIALLVKVKY